MSIKVLRFVGLFAVVLIAGCERQTTPEIATDESASLKTVFDGTFLVGVALNEEQFTQPVASDDALIKKHFNTVTPENVLKWEIVHPEPGRYDFDASDRYVAFADEREMVIIGHVLVWHSQTPDWVFEDDEGGPLDRKSLLARMRDHIFTIVGRYKGRIAGWDVVNEALNEDGTLRQSPWMNIIGPDYIAKAFEYAHEADPDAGLYYNDYSLPNKLKGDGAVALIEQLQAEGVPVTGIGVQGHYGLIWPSAGRLDSTLTAFEELGIEVMMTEVDIDVLPPPFRDQGADVDRTAELWDEANPWPEQLPDSMQQVLAQRYRDLFNVIIDHSDIISRVTFWGLTDANSWKNNWPVRGRANYPLLFDRVGEPKPAFEAVIEASAL